jgi:hypothetical protein
MTQERIQAGVEGVKAAETEAVNEPTIQKLGPTTNDKIRVIHGPNEHYVSLSGKTVGEARKKLKDVLNLPGDADAIVGDKTVADDFVLVPGMNLEFQKSTGVKGIEMPTTTIEELRNDQPDAHTIITTVLMEFAKEMCRSSEEVRCLGLEKAYETLIELVEAGIMKVRYDSTKDEFVLLKFEESSQTYEPAPLLLGGK